MSDNKHWFKVWTSILTDPAFNMASLEERGAWVTLGALVAKHGTNGAIEVDTDYLSRVLSVPLEVILRLENVNVKVSKNDNGKVTVSYVKWHKYQVDPTGYERLKKYRKGKKITVQEENKNKKRIRREQEENKKETKRVFGEFKHVRLTEDEHGKLVTRFGKAGAIHWIKTLDEGIHQHGYKYRSHYMAIIKWSNKEPAPTGQAHDERKRALRAADEQINFLKKCLDEYTSVGNKEKVEHYKRRLDIEIKEREKLL